jgi:hypothetical protein
MTTQSVSIELPDEIYRRLERMATETQRSLEEVIFQTVRGNLPPALDDLLPERRDLVADLQHLNDDALWAVAREPLSARRWRRHQHLLHKAETSTLTSKEQAELAALREATDRFVIRRSCALAPLTWCGHTIPTAL